MYGIGGEETLTEEMLLHLDGYEHAQPVRVGNGAYAQKQHDVWGALLDSIYLHTKSRDGLAESTWEILCKQVEDAIAAWREPDRGIWEVRGEPQHFTSSKVMCWVACDRGARLARLREDHERGERWQQAADEIHADVCEHGVDERGVFCQHYDTDGARRLVPADPARALPAARRRARDRHRQRDRRRAHDQRPRAALPRRGDRRRPVGRGGHLRDLLVLARQRAGRDRRARPRPRAVREDARLRLAA